jgi:formylglycine-generating enzyme required for sulfatase activity
MVRGRPPSAQSDIYALGATLFEMLAGRPPFTGDSAMSVMMKHVSEPVPDVRQFAPETPDYLTAIVETAMAKDPTKRFQTAGAMAAALRKGIANPSMAPSVVQENAAPPVRSGRVSDEAAALADDVPTRPPTWRERAGRPPEAGGRPGFPFPLWMMLAVAGVALTCLVLGAAGGLFVVWRLQQAAQVAPTATAPATQTLTAASATAPPTAPPTELAASEAAPPTDTAVPAPSATTKVETGVPAGMVLIPAGSFQMGSNNGGSDERPPHPANVDAYYLDETEVTNGAYGACVKDGACTAPINSGSFTRGTYFNDPAFANFPATSVQWAQAAQYCQWNEGKRLPTEAEWEFAARGSDGRAFPWGDTFELNRLPAGEPDTVAVGSYRDGASPFGVLDMAGNAVEWVSDFYDAQFYARAEPDSPVGPPNGTEHVARGGAFGNPDPAAYTTTRRYHLELNATDVDVGFRCAKTP